MRRRDPVERIADALERIANAMERDDEQDAAKIDDAAKALAGRTRKLKRATREAGQPGKGRT